MTIPNEPADAPPLPPRAPEAWECCQSGCDPCVHDLYQDALDRYEQELAEWQRRRAERTSNLTTK